MGSENSNTTESKALVLVGYAATMQAIQRFEWALKQLAVTRNETLDDIDFDEAWRRTEKILRKPIGSIDAKLMPANLRRELKRLRNTRNEMAHEVLLTWQFERNLGLRSDVEYAETFVDIEAEFSKLAAEVESAAHEHLESLGINPDEIRVGKNEMLDLLRP